MEKQSGFTLSLKIFQAALGLFIFSFGLAMTIQANVGLGPWECLSMGTTKHIPLSYGIVHTIISVCILLADIALKEKIGFATLLDTFLVGNFVEFFLWLGIIPLNHGLVTGALMFIPSVFIMACGQCFYMAAGQGCGPRDTLLLALGKRMPRVPIGVVQTGILGTALLLGFLMGGPVGLGTVLFVFGSGFALQTVTRLAHFEPRKVVHQNLMQACRSVSFGNKKRAYN